MAVSSFMKLHREGYKAHPKTFNFAFDQTEWPNECPSPVLEDPEIAPLRVRTLVESNQCFKKN